MLRGTYKIQPYELPVINLPEKPLRRSLAALSGANDYLIKPLDRNKLFAREINSLSLKNAVNMH
jgi:DNA-binding response OmpR family regulator